ncbi:MAG: hypothetical protein RJA70_1411 [Pseudomonadota bacterium]|jgi:mannitol-specific phosphotransferase system IIBC component
MNSPETLTSEVAQAPKLTVLKALRALWKAALITLAVVAVLVASAYGVGRLETASQVEEAQLLAASAQQHAGNAEARALRLEARRQLHLALLRLEERNFGSAQQTLTTSVRLLRAGQPNEQLKALADAMGQYRVPVGEDVSGQLATLIKWVQEFDSAEPMVSEAKPAVP